MTFQDAKVEGNKITLTKEELTEKLDHYLKVAAKFKSRKGEETDIRYYLYLGKVELLIDVLKMFEPVDFV